MKTKDLREVLDSELSTDEKMAKIQAMWGVDINNAKNSASEDNAKLQTEIEDLKKQNATLQDQAKQYADYADLKKFHDDTVANTDKEQKLSYLTGVGFKHPELLIDKVDFSKAKYDAEKKTFTGMDEIVKGLKETYKDLYSEPESGTSGVNPTNGGQHTGNQMDGVEAAFYAMNPSLKPRS